MRLTLALLIIITIALTIASIRGGWTWDERLPQLVAGFSDGPRG